MNRLSSLDYAVSGKYYLELMCVKVSVSGNMNVAKSSKLFSLASLRAKN
jgi:hypothetical protein